MLTKQVPMEGTGRYIPGQHVEVWLAGWDQWLSGTVESAGFLDGIACVRVLLDGQEQLSVWRVDQIKAMEGLFSQ